MERFITRIWRSGRINYEDHLGCPVRFRADWNAVVFESKTMQMEVRGANNKLLKVLEMACRKILGPTPKKEDIVHDVRSLIMEGCTRGDVNIDTVASKLSMSSKTLSLIEPQPERCKGNSPVEGLEHKPILQTAKRKLLRLPT